MTRGDVHLVRLDPTLRLVKRLGALPADALTEVLGGLQEMFAE